MPGSNTILGCVCTSTLVITIIYSISYLFNKCRRHHRQNNSKNDDIKMQYCEPYIVTTKPSNSDGVYDECHVPEQEASYYDSI